MNTRLVTDHSAVYQKFHGIFWLHIYEHGTPPTVLRMTEDERKELDEDAFPFVQDFPHQEMSPLRKFLGVPIEIIPSEEEK